MAAFTPHLTSTLPFHSAPRRLPPADSVAPPRGARVLLPGLRHPGHIASNCVCFENAIRLWTKHQKTALFASETDSLNTDSSTQSGAGDDNPNSPDGPPVLTILAGIVVFLLVFSVLGSFLTRIIGLVFGAGKS